GGTCLASVSPVGYDMLSAVFAIAPTLVTSASTASTGEAADASSISAASGNHSFLPAWIVPKSQILLVIELTSQRKCFDSGVPCGAVAWVAAAAENERASAAKASAARRARVGMRAIVQSAREENLDE